MKNILKFSIFITLISLKSFAIGDYKKGDVLYNWKNTVVNIRQNPDIKSEIITTIYFGDRCIVVDESPKTYKFSVQEIAPVIKYDSLNEAQNFRGFTINGFWVKVKTKSGEIGYIFDGYLSKINPNFELTETYFDLNFGRIKSSDKKYPKSISDNAYSRKRLYKNGSYVIENGSDYNGHSHFFIPNCTLEEGYFLVLKSRSDLLELHKSSGDDATNYIYSGNQLSFTTSLEAISITKITHKGLKGIEILIEAWD